MSSKSNYIFLGIVILAIIGLAIYFISERKPMAPSQTMSFVSTPPSVRGFYDGQEVLFIHTEVSDEKVSKTLSDMMNSPVIFVPRLNRVATEVLSEVFVFTNGVRGMGPMGFQPDIFNSVPGDEEYSPLRTIHLVSWKQGIEALELRSFDELKNAERDGGIVIERTNVVVNMPIVKWPGGSR